MGQTLSFEAAEQFEVSFVPGFPGNASEQGGSVTANWRLAYFEGWFEGVIRLHDEGRKNIWKG